MSIFGDAPIYDGNTHDTVRGGRIRNVQTGADIYFDSKGVTIYRTPKIAEVAFRASVKIRHYETAFGPIRTLLQDIQAPVETWFDQAFRAHANRHFITDRTNISMRARPVAAGAMFDRTDTWSLHPGWTLADSSQVNLISLTAQGTVITPGLPSQALAYGNGLDTVAGTIASAGVIPEYWVVTTSERPVGTSFVIEQLQFAVRAPGLGPVTVNSGFESLLQFAYEIQFVEITNTNSYITF